MSHKEFKGQHELGAASPSQWSYIVRTTRVASPAEREEALAANDHNVFAFPASLLVADFLSDAGCSAASDVQWASLLRGDEAYGRNHGYYALLDAARDVFERGTENPGELVRRLIVNERNSTWAASDEELANPPCGGFANGGTHQLERPNFFMVPQQRCAEFLLFAGSRKNLGAPGADGALTIVPSNGWFDTTEAHARAAAFVPVEIPDRSIPEVPLCKVRTENHFKGNIDVQKLKALIKEKGEKAVAFVLMTMTNSREAGHPVSMANLREAASVAHSHNIPVVYDAARFAINAWAIARFENEYKGVSISKIVKEMFSYCDAFVVGCKSSSNSGGILAFRDRGMFHKRFSTPAHDIGIVIKELQILSYGNDSYGGLSGRDIMAMAVGLGQVVNPVSLERNVMQTITFAEHLDAAGVPGVSTSGSAIYIDVDKFFGRKTNPEDFMGAGIVSELIRLYGIRVAEMGPLTFQNWTDEDRPNFVRISVPQGTYSDEHVLYAVAAIAELYRQREHMPRMEIVFGKDLKLRHFQAGLKPVYPAAGKIQA